MGWDLNLTRAFQTVQTRRKAACAGLESWRCILELGNYKWVSVASACSGEGLLWRDEAGYRGGAHVCPQFRSSD